MLNDYTNFTILIINCVLPNFDLHGICISTRFLNIQILTAYTLPLLSSPLFISPFHSPLLLSSLLSSLLFFPFLSFWLCFAPLFLFFLFSFFPPPPLFPFFPFVSILCSLLPFSPVHFPPSLPFTFLTPLLYHLPCLFSPHFISLLNWIVSLYVNLICYPFSHILFIK